MSDLDPNALAIEYLLATRSDRDAADELAAKLDAMPEDALRAGLADDVARKAFWLDVYNAEVVRAGVVDLKDRLTRFRHFRRASVTIAGRRLSLDAIENGILRRSQSRLGLGYLPNPVPGSFERAHRVDRVDPRIHFALNCGAASCPPISAYDPARLDEQLELATRSYLSTEVEVEDDLVRVPAVMLWYIGDFGGPAGVRRMLRRAGLDEAGRRLRFRAWDWTPAPDHWMGD
jgi:hypothetical protein